MSVSIILPTYNERKNLPVLIDGILKVDFGKDFEIVIVDDDSPDGTGDIADGLAEKYQNIKVLHRKAKLGLGTAIVAGMKMSTGDIIVVMDTDLSHPPALIPVFIKEIENNHDLVVGSRYVEGGKIENWQITRVMISFVATAMAKLVLSVKVKDPMSGFFAVRRDIIQNLNLRTEGYKILLEILVKSKPLRVKEVPYKFRDRKEGTSKLDIKEIVRYIKQVKMLHASKSKL